MSNTIYWHDYETFGVDPRRDRASQFAGLRTDEELNIIGEPLVMYCQPSPDMLPHPAACMVTGISPYKALQEGLPEAEFIARIHQEFALPQSCVAGYNSLRFDDEVTRQLLYRNFYDPYEREWKNGNSRWDIIDMVRLCYALRPEGIVWPKKEDGSPSFRLEELTVANGIAHEAAHDALSDVTATIAMAKLIKDKQPKLYAYAYGLRNKKKVQEQIDIVSKKPILHVSSMYPAAYGCLALVAPLTQHPTDKNGVIVYDLREDPREWMELSVEQVQQRLFTRQDELAEGVKRIALKVLHVNRCPIVASKALLTDELAKQYQIDESKAREHWQLLLEHPQAIAKVASAFDKAHEDRPGDDDPDYMIYSGGFFGGQDKQAMAQIRGATGAQLSVWPQAFVDKRLDTLLFRYRARNFASTLREEERREWEAFCHQRLQRSDEVRAAGASANEYFAEIAKLRDEHQDAKVLALLDDLEAYGRELTST